MPDQGVAYLNFVFDMAQLGLGHEDEAISTFALELHIFGENIGLIVGERALLFYTVQRTRG